MKLLFSKLINKRKFALKSYGTSMFPLLQPEDIIYYDKLPYKNIDVNDIIIGKKNTHLFTHRIIYKTESYVITKGDNNLASDGKIYVKQIIAKAYQLKRNKKIINPESLYLVQSTLYFQEIVKIKRAFEKEKINFVFLKGLPLHLYYEETHPRRFYLDCDILIKKQYSTKLQVILRRYGYKLSSNLLSKRIKRNIGEEVEMSYYKMLNVFAITFDLHFEIDITIVHLNRLEALYKQKLIDQLTQEFLLTKKTVEIQNESFVILSPSFFILYLALHFFHHNFRGAFRLEFMNKVITKSNLNWNTIAKTIDTYGFKAFVYPVFIMLKKYYQTNIPLSFIKAIQPEEQMLTYINKKILPINIFNDESRIIAGRNRFENLFFLSPRPLLIKLSIFFNLQVLYSIFWTLQRRLSFFFSNRRKVL